MDDGRDGDRELFAVALAVVRAVAEDDDDAVAALVADADVAELVRAVTVVALLTGADVGMEALVWRNGTVEGFRAVAEFAARRQAEGRDAEGGGPVRPE